MTTDRQRRGGMAVRRRRRRQNRLSVAELQLRSAVGIHSSASTSSGAVNARERRAVAANQLPSSCQSAADQLPPPPR